MMKKKKKKKKRLFQKNKYIAPNSNRRSWNMKRDENRKYGLWVVSGSKRRIQVITGCHCTAENRKRQILWHDARYSQWAK